jgi:DNA-directed RNA polymerase specialized sigma24 family protein
MPVQLKDSVHKAHRLPRTDSVLMDRAELLAPADRDLLEAVLIHGTPTTMLSRMMRISCASLRRRIHRLTRRLVSKEFLDAARAIPYLEPDDGTLARQVFCEGTSQRELVGVMGVSMYHLRYRMMRLRAEIAVLARLRRTGQRQTQRM